MQQLRTDAPRPGQLWLSRPPYLMIAHILGVERLPDRAVVSYELADEEGNTLEQVDHAVLDDAWWQAFQPLKRRYG
jgi:hypothetical protein